MNDDTTLKGGGGIASDDNTKSYTTQIDPTGVYQKVGCWLLVLPEVLGWYEKMNLTGFTLRKREDDWLLIVRAERKGLKKVCFTSGPRPFDCAWMLAIDLKNGAITWKDDKYG